MADNELSASFPEMSVARKTQISAANIGNYEEQIYQSMVVPVIRS